MPSPPHTALVEFSTSHLMCLRSQIRFLKESRRNCRTLPLHARTGTRVVPDRSGPDPLPRCAERLEGPLADRDRTSPGAGRPGGRSVVFNTAEGNHVRDFSLIAPGGLLYAGFLHHTNKLGRSFTQRLISRRIRRYYVLMDYLLGGLPASTGCRFAAVSPIFHAASRRKRPPNHRANSGSASPARWSSGGVTTRDSPRRSEDAPGPQDPFHPARLRPDKGLRRVPGTARSGRAGVRSSWCSRTMSARGFLPDTLRDVT